MSDGEGRLRDLRGEGWMSRPPSPSLISPAHPAGGQRYGTSDVGAVSLGRALVRRPRRRRNRPHRGGARTSWLPTRILVATSASSTCRATTAWASTTSGPAQTAGDVPHPSSRRGGRGTWFSAVVRMRDQLPAAPTRERWSDERNDGEPVPDPYHVPIPAGFSQISSSPPPGPGSKPSAAGPPTGWPPPNRGHSAIS